MAEKSLVIVESPTKARTISKILGKDFTVVSSMGHIIDLPEKKLGVDIENGFVPEYTVITKQRKTLDSLKKDVKGKTKIYVATDPDREGEAIGWNIKEKLAGKKKIKILRVSFHEITPAAIKAAFASARDFDANMIEAQVGRRILDRIVGYFLSPLLWKKIARGLSAGRVQSVALKLIVDREKDIRKFVPQEYWEIEAQLKKEYRQFSAKLEKINEKKAEIKNKAEAEKVAAELKHAAFVVAAVKKTEKKRTPGAPFITSTLQQEAFNKLRFNGSRTMIIAQQLYEGIDIGEENPVGLITYMRTDSPHVASEAIKEVRHHISKKYGPEFLPAEPNVYKVKKLAQEAHEAIRPAMVNKSPESLKDFLSVDQYKLYELIFNRFIASQMTPARMETVSVDIEAGRCIFGASGSRVLFAGWTAVYQDEEEQELKKINELPALAKGEILNLLKLTPSQHFTKPPPRFSDSSLVKALEEDGIGRPSTYAPIIATLILRDYIRRLRGYFHPTELGEKVCEMLSEYFPGIMDMKFTALMEEELDEIEEGRLGRAKVLQDFYAPFKKSLDHAQKHIKKEIVFTKDICSVCGKPMVVKWGRRGKFLSCSDFPRCKNAKSITSGVKCPQPVCGGELIERRSRRGFFYGCSNYPKCTYISRDLPQQDEAGQENKASSG